MRHRLTLLAAIPLLVLVLIAPSVAGSIRSQVSWIESLPGFGGIQARSETSTQLDYAATILGSGAPAWQSLRSNLIQRGWNVTDKADVVAGGASVRSLIAYKGDLQMTASVQDSGAAAVVAIVVRRGASVTVIDGGTYAPGSVVVTGNGSVVNAGGDIIISGNHENRSYTFSGQDAVINGNHNALNAYGRVDNITVNGNHNTVTVDARIDDLVVNGNHNSIRISASKNPNLDVVDNGSYNTVVRIK